MTVEANRVQVAAARLVLQLDERSDRQTPAAIRQLAIEGTYNSLREQARSRIGLQGRGRRAFNLFKIESTDKILLSFPDLQTTPQVADIILGRVSSDLSIELIFSRVEDEADLSDYVATLLRVLRAKLRRAGKPEYLALDWGRGATGGYAAVRPLDPIVEEPPKEMVSMNKVDLVNVNLDKAVQGVFWLEERKRPEEKYNKVASVTVTASRWSRRFSRGLDVMVSTLLLVILCVPMLVIAVLVRWSSPGPALLRQRRIGIDQHAFVLLRFRTMYTGASDKALRALIAAELRGEDTALESSTKLSGDARVTRVGAWLRRMNLDELPQLVNVLRGDMSLVGPRPPLEWEAPMFPEAYVSRFAVRPGITGLWQVEGRNTMSTLEMLELDVAYVRDRAEHGLRIDLSILARTVPAVLRGDGAR